MIMWEYKILEIDNSKDIDHLVILLNFHGIDGWELVSLRQHPSEINKSRLFFKRIKREKDTTLDG